MNKNDYEPLIDQIRNRFKSWTNRFLSYGGRLQLIKSVIASITNFWQSSFPLPQGCLDKIESMCSCFLWTGIHDSSTGAKVNWHDVCSPISEGGLGIRRLRDTGTVFSLHLIWRLFNSSSLWVSWVQRYLLRNSSFWDISEDSTMGSWIWRKLLLLRPIAAPFIRAEVKDGTRVHFWHDVWLSNLRLWDSFTPQNAAALGLPRTCRVADLVSDSSWQLRRPRNAVLRPLVDLVLAQQPPNPQAGPDLYLWKHDEDTYKPYFNATRTWELVRTPSLVVSWWRLVWFKLAIPRQSFILWLVFHNRLSTGSRMREWGQTQHCTFCGDRDETREHLFFGCPYTFQLWLLLARNLLPRSINPGWLITIASIQNHRRSKIDSVLLRMALQSAVYAIWRERNNRIHSGIYKSFQSIAGLTSRLIREKVISYGASNLEFSNQLRDRWDAVWNNGQTSLLI